MEQPARLVQLGWEEGGCQKILSGWNRAWWIFVINPTPEIKFSMKTAPFWKDDTQAILKESHLWGNKWGRESKMKKAAYLAAWEHTQVERRKSFLLAVPVFLIILIQQRKLDEWVSSVAGVRMETEKEKDSVLIILPVRGKQNQHFDPVCAFCVLNTLSQGSLIGTDNWDRTGSLRSMLQSLINSMVVSWRGKRVKDSINKGVWFNDTVMVRITFSLANLLFDIDTLDS